MSKERTHAHTHIYTLIYIYIFLLKPLGQHLISNSEPGFQHAGLRNYILGLDINLAMHRLVSRTILNNKTG